MFWVTGTSWKQVWQILELHALNKQFTDWVTKSVVLSTKPKRRTHQLLAVFICLNVTRLQRHLSSCTKHNCQANATLSWKTWLYPCVIVSFFPPPSQRAHFRLPLLLVVKTWGNKRDVSYATTHISVHNSADTACNEPAINTADHSFLKSGKM